MLTSHTFVRTFFHKTWTVFLLICFRALAFPKAHSIAIAMLICLLLSEGRGEINYEFHIALKLNDLREKSKEVHRWPLVSFSPKTALCFMVILLLHPPASPGVSWRLFYICQKVTAPFWNCILKTQLKIHSPSKLQYKDTLTMFPPSWHILNNCKETIDYKDFLPLAHQKMNKHTLETLLIQCPY